MLALAGYDERTLAEVEGEVHDWFFDVADVRYDRARGEVVVPFRRWSYEQARPVPRRRLRAALRRTPTRSRTTRRRGC